MLRRARGSPCTKLNPAAACLAKPRGITLPRPTSQHRREAFALVFGTAAAIATALAAGVWIGWLLGLVTLSAIPPLIAAAFVAKAIETATQTKPALFSPEKPAGRQKQH